MAHTNVEGRAPGVLATDLDGTLIPLEGVAQNQTDLAVLRESFSECSTRLTYVTGRHFESVVRAIQEFQLPQPDSIICDVGSTICKRHPTGSYETVVAYSDHLDEIIAQLPIDALSQQLRTFEGLQLQESEKQGRFKLSFYADANQLNDHTDRIQAHLKKVGAPYSIIASVDPFNGDGLIDLLPSSVSKAYALRWWIEYSGLDPEGVVFAGDSGNDLAALTEGYRTIVVGNADRTLARNVYQAHRLAGWTDRLLLARGKATSGVLEGCRWFHIVDQPTANIESLGATLLRRNTTHFRVWAPKRQAVDVEVLGEGVSASHRLTRSEFGYFSGTIEDAGAHARYQFVLDSSVKRPDPASRFQPDGVHGASQIVDPHAYPWTDQNWRGVSKADLVIYEMHIGTWTDDGTFRGAIERLSELVDLGITAVEVMPITQSPGRWNWGYDGVDLFAIRNTYGEPDDFKAFVDACHEHGIAVILDVVYNHLGPEGNYLADFAPYFSRKHRTPWGEALNFDGRHSQHVRRFVTDNALYWLEEYHLDGLRLDAVHFMMDDSKPSIMDDVRTVVAHYAQNVERTIHLVAEANVFDQELLQSREGFVAYDAIWCDCLMHSIYSHMLPELHLAHREYLGAEDITRALRYGYIYAKQDTGRVAIRRHDTNRQVEARQFIPSFVMALQTHDCVGNHPLGKRIHQLASPQFQKAAAAIMLLYPSVPLIFMGEESAVESPFPFFADFEDPRLRKAVEVGRRREYPQHSWPKMLSPCDPETFQQAKCSLALGRNNEMFQWYQSLIALRRKGIDSGWLNVTGMSSEFCEGRSLFTLQFAWAPVGEINVLVRLTPAARQDVKPVSIPVEGKVLLSSEPAATTELGSVLMHANHAVISCSGSAS